VKKIVVLLILCFCACSAHSAVVTHNVSAPLQSTYWSQVFTLPKFDPTLGTLNSVTFELTGRVEGSVSFESLDVEPATVSMTLGAIVTLFHSDNTVIATTSPSVTTTDYVGAYDGVIDLDGASGRTHSGLWSSTVQSYCIASCDLSQYVGPGTFDVTVAATGNSGGHGAGNLLMLFRASASAAAQVRYDYTAIPEPSSFMAMSLGAVSLFGLARRRRC